jgi:murein DD-endopeptidase MepM/ murein hydrolase activator NlpD
VSSRPARATDPGLTEVEQVRSRAFVVVTLLVALSALVVPALADTVQDAERQLEEARERRAAVEERLATEAGDLEGLSEAVEAMERELARLDERDAALQAELDEIEDGLARRSRLAFMRGDTTTLTVLVNAQDFGDIANGAALLESLALRDRASLEDADALRTQVAANRALQQARRDELGELEADLEAQVAQLMEDLDQLERDEERFGEELQSAREEQRRREEEAARAAAEAAAAEQAAAQAAGGSSDAPAQDDASAEGDPPADAVPSGGLACPVGDPVFFTDTWGAPRSGGRSHKGVDMMARHGTPVYAITSGTITRLNNNGLGGISIYMFGDDGNEYYYTHLQGYADISTGMQVGAGRLIAYVGSTGNASASAPHLHFEVHPGGGSSVNPYPYAARACGR